MSAPRVVPDRLTALCGLSARLGQDIRLVQAGGGNTSIKEDGLLWVKASGKWLIRAEQEEMFVPIPLTSIRASIDANREYVEEWVSPSGAVLRPSVETTMHALLPHHTVIHVHSVNTIAWAVRPDGEAVLAPRLDGLRWAWIPYVHPGLPLTQRIGEALDGAPDVLVLENHGLVVGADSCEAAEELLHETERRLDTPVRPAPAVDRIHLQAIAPEGWRVPEDDRVHALATDPVNLRIAAAGTMYPDHCVYLGPAAAAVWSGEPPLAAAERYERAHGFTPVVLLVEGSGVLVSERISRAAWELLLCLLEVTTRIDPVAPRQYLTEFQVAALMNWDAEKYRIALAQQQEAAQSASKPSIV